jgi:diguanylate cyclase (GGDEF)-like protein
LQSICRDGSLHQGDLMTLLPMHAPQIRRLLVVDDSALARYLVRTGLKDDQLAFLEAADGLEGLTAACELQPDLILLDLGLPGWDGYETMRRLKDDPRTRSIPVIVVSSHTSVLEKARGLELGAVDYVTKPFDSTELRARVEVALRTKAQLDLFKQRAHVDPLTGLWNRHALEERLAIEWAVCQRRKWPLALFMADLDHFKQVNDRYGHSAGDAVLRAAAEALRVSVRIDDFVARYGGEEFVVIAANCSLAGALTMANRFRVELATCPTVFRGRPLHVTASVGITEFMQPDLVEAFDLLDEADVSLYQAKASGRNAVCLWNREAQRAYRAPDADINQARTAG